FAFCLNFFFSSRRRHTRSKRDWSSDVCSSDLRSRNELLDDERATISGCDCFVEYLAKFLWCGYVMDLTPSFKLSVCPLATVAGFKYQWIMPIGSRKRGNELVYG